MEARIVRGVCVDDEDGESRSVAPVEEVEGNCTVWSMETPKNGTQGGMRRLRKECEGRGKSAKAEERV